MKLQSAIEYLTTYGWALLIIAVAAVVLFSLLNATSSPIQECIMQAGFSCPSIYLSQSGDLSINLVQATQYPIQVSAIGCTNQHAPVDMTPVNNPPSNVIPLQIGANYTFNVQCYTNGTAWSGAIKSIFTGYVIINYTNAYTDFPDTVYGNIRVSATR
ncbi:MAG: hypothetical protein ACYCO0_00505 [Candidatus Micrarchaeaceae archaeon]